MIFWILYILAEAKIQGYLIENKKWKPIYIQLFIIRGMVAIVYGIFLDVTPEQYLPLLLFQITSFWIFFDLFLNFFRKKPWNYKGKTSGWLDKIPYIPYYILKLIAITVMILSYIKGLDYWSI